MADRPVGEVGGQLLLGTASVALVDQLCGLSSIADRWERGSPNALLAVGTTWGDHLLAVALVAIAALVGFRLTGRPQRGLLMAIGLFGLLTILAVVPMMEGYARLLQTTPILELGRFQAGLVRQAAALLFFGALFLAAALSLHRSQRPAS